MNLKFETIVQIFRKIIQLNAVIILKSTNSYYRKIISKSGRKMDLYPAMHVTLCIMLTIHSEYLTGLIISQWDFVSIELIHIACYVFKKKVMLSSNYKK